MINATEFLSFEFEWKIPHGKAMQNEKKNGIKIELWRISLHWLSYSGIKSVLNGTMPVLHCPLTETQEN